MAVDPPPTRGRYFVEALGRGLALLDCFIDEPGPHSLLELSRRVGLGMPTTLRLIRTLEEAGYVRQDPQTKRYRLSWKMLQLQDVTTSILDYADVARPYLEDLAAALGEDTGMAVLEDTEVRHAIRVSSSRLISANVRPGARFPAHATAMGKVLLAGLDVGVIRQLATRQPFEKFTPTTATSVDELLPQLREVARQGYALSNEEWEPGLRSLAAPVHARDGRVVAAVCVIVVRPGITTRTMERDFLPGLLEAAEAISGELGYRPPYQVASA
ncbi:MAG TPA: IclR family transcriptional regulator [Chloroflexota bacterium]|jgi:IclR family pca regulon transcriptional regulator|nr:IclR family transcriptional regulator [Chloroflexota bacterium]